jgi:hypothetical protein
MEHTRIKSATKHTHNWQVLEGSMRHLICHSFPLILSRMQKQICCIQECTLSQLSLKKGTKSDRRQPAEQGASQTSVVNIEARKSPLFGRPNSSTPIRLELLERPLIQLRHGLHSPPPIAVCSVLPLRSISLSGFLPNHHRRVFFCNFSFESISSAFLPSSLFNLLFPYSFHQP